MMDTGSPEIIGNMQLVPLPASLENAFKNPKENLDEKYGTVLTKLKNFWEQNKLCEYYE